MPLTSFRARYLQRPAIGHAIGQILARSGSAAGSVRLRPTIGPIQRCLVHDWTKIGPKVQESGVPTGVEMRTPGKAILRLNDQIPPFQLSMVYTAPPSLLSRINLRLWCFCGERGVYLPRIRRATQRLRSDRIAQSPRNRREGLKVRSASTESV